MGERRTDGPELMRLKHLVTLDNGRADTAAELPYVGLENIESGTGRLVGVSDPEGDGPAAASRFVPGDVLFSKLRPYLAKAFVAEHEGLSTTELLVMKTDQALEPRFLLYALLSPDFIDEVDASTYGSKMPRADWDFIGNVKLPVPPLDQQRAIAARLDRETARLDALADGYRQLVARLAEKRRALVAHAVTRGLDAAAETRDSGVEWLGRVPAHWHVERTRWLFSERDERSETGNEELLTVSHLTGVTPRSDKNVNMFMAESLEGYKRCLPDDLVINTMWAWMGAMGTSPVEGIVSPAYNVYEPSVEFAPGFLDLLVRMEAFVGEATRLSKGVWSSRLRLYPSEFFEIRMAVPPVEEQAEIVAHVERQSAALAALAADAQAALALLAERRGALIAEAVSGAVPVEAG